MAPTAQTAVPLASPPTPKSDCAVVEARSHLRVKGKNELVRAYVLLALP